ncbi:hypothetical protein [Mesobacillus zeae]|uniref:hypothetical protein n=1 Tax=Mesobacillus zeae TaxID=1917180 RepID=UPI00300A1769
MAESKKIRFKQYFGRNNTRLLNILKKQGQFIKFSSELGYLYLVEVGELAGKAVSLKVSMKSGRLNIIDVVTAA